MINPMHNSQTPATGFSRRFVALAAVLSLAAGASSALAQAGGFSTMSMTQSDGQNTYTLTMQDDKVSAEVNGKKVPEDRIRRRNGRVEILDENGKVAHTFNFRGHAAAGAGGTPGWTAITPTDPIAPLPPEAPVAAQLPREPPPVMMGVTMDDDSEGGITITSVVDGLPAQKAGVQVDDVIVKIDDSPAEGAKTLRDILKSKKAGDKLTLVVKRDGEEKTLTLDLVAYDAKTLGSRAPAAMVLGEEKEWSKEAAQAIERAMKEIEASGAFKPERLKAEVQQELKNAMKALEQAQNEAGVQLRGYMNPENGSRWFYGPNSGQRFVLPRAPGGAVQVERLESMEERFDQLEERLDKLSEALDRLTEKLDKKNP